MKRTLVIPFLCILLFGCKHATNFNEFPAVSYSKDISLIIAANCAQSGCHGSTGRQSFELLSYNDLMKNCEVNAGDPENSKLYEVITTYNKEDAMPRAPYSSLPDQQIQKIYLWIGQGAKNN